MHPPSAMAPVILHSLTASDARFLFDLASDPVVRAQSLDPQPPTWDAHQQWLTAFLADPKRHGWVVLFQHEPAAVVRLDHISRLGAKIHVAVHQSVRGRGIGTAAIYHGTLCAVNEGWGVLASIKPDNHASMRAFEKCDYVRVGPGTDSGQDVIVYAHG